MAYILSEATNIMGIKEREFGTGNEIKFTAFTSCIGVVVIGNGGGGVTGVHLALTGTDGSNFGPAAAAAVLEKLPSHNTSIVIGRISYWKDGANGARAGYNALVGGLAGMTEYQFADGVYGAMIDGGAIEITY